jgi:hypothetical protein
LNEQKDKDHEEKKTVEIKNYDRNFNQNNGQFNSKPNERED